MNNNTFIPSEAGLVQYADDRGSWRVNAYWTEQIYTAHRMPITSYLVFNDPITGVALDVNLSLGTFTEATP